MDKVSLKIAGKIWQSWKSVNTSHSISAVTGEHQLSITSTWQKGEILTLKEGMPIELFIGKDKVATGYITNRTPSYDSKNISYQITARCKTIDLVESSLVHQTGEWKEIKLDAIANDICKTYGISVAVETDMGAPFLTVRIEQGESPFELLERLARQRAILLTSNQNGDLVLTRASKKMLDISLELGKNIRAARGNFSESEKFSKYIVKGSAASWSNETNEQLAVTIDDPSIQRYRPKILLTEEVFTVEGASRRGQWQKQRALGFSNNVEITVGGWRMPNGKLWPLNHIVKVLDPIMGIDDVLLIASLSRVEDEDGRSTVLSLVPPTSMDIPAEKETISGQW